MAHEVALVVGGSTGIGAEVVRQMVAEGVRVANCDINERDGQRLAAETGSAFILGDVSDDESLGRAIAGCVETVGVPNYAVLNSGVMTVPGDAPFQALEEASLEAYRRVMSINLDGVFHGLRHLIPLMRDTPDAASRAITVTASRAGVVPTAADVIYAASKAGVIQMVRSAAAANRKSHLRINALCPGTVDTTLIAEVVRELKIPLVSASDMAAEIIALARHGDNGEVRARLHDQPAFAVGTFDDNINYVAPAESAAR